MIVKIFKRGRGTGTGPVEYLLGKNRDRKLANVLRGKPDQTVDLINSLDFASKYTSGCLSFEEHDIPEEEKQRIMDSFEQNLMAGMSKQQYEILWVQHQDKDRLELNFVIPNVELKTGKRLQPYYDKADRQRVNAWQEITNNDFNLTDPNDPEKRRMFNYGRNLPEQKKQAIEHITNGLLAYAETGEIQNRQDVIQNLKDNGFNVTRQTKKSISIMFPGEARATRLTGALYEQSFKSGEGVREEIEANIKRYRQQHEQRVKQARQLYQEAHSEKSAEHRKRFKPERIEVSKVVERKHQQLRKDAENSTSENNAGVQHRADIGAIHSSNSIHSANEVRINKINDWVNNNERNNETTRTITETITATIRSALQRIADAIRPDSGTSDSDIRQYQQARQRRQQLEKGRGWDNTMRPM